jgi:hypothetical protein
MTSSYDKWLTTNPFDADDSFFEAVTENYSDLFFEAQEDKFIFSDKETDLINRCISKDKTPQQTANIIERYFYIYNK